jgi:hypothetical protein
MPPQVCSLLHSRLGKHFGPMMFLFAMDCACDYTRKLECDFYEQFQDKEILV